MAKLWSDFYNWVLPEVSACPSNVADQMIREACIEFYDKSGILVDQLSPISVVSGQATYNLTPPVSYDVNRIEEMFMGSLRLVPADLPSLARMYIDWLTITGTPQYYLRETTDTFRLVPEPDPLVTYTDTITARVVLVPTRLSTGIAEDWIFENYADDIARGALARLMMMPSKPWTDMQRSVGYDMLFRSGWVNARILSDRGKSGSVLQARLKRFF